MHVQQNANSIYLTRGDTATLYISVAGMELMSGDVIEMTVRKWIDAPEKKIYKRITNFEDGKAVIRFESSDTSALDFGIYVYDVQLTHENDVSTIITPSVFEVGAEVTYE